jgi:quercetin dioxygenase-like cupin family protein
MGTSTGVVRSADQAEERWFFGGAVHRWLIRAEETGGSFFLHEELLERGKATPLHTHPAHETMIVLDGSILMHIAGVEQQVDAGGVALAPEGVAHAFKVTSPTARLLCLHTPGSCEQFYLEASEPIADADRTADFDRVMASARSTGGMQVVGPPPFAD